MPHVYKIVIPLGLEELAYQEVGEKLPMAKILGREKGLVILESDDLPSVLALKSPSRIYLHLEKFKARDFPKLFQKVSKMPWHQWLSAMPAKFSVSTETSRLLHSDRIEETLTKAIAAAFKAQPIAKKWQEQASKFNPVHLKVRVFNDEVEIDLDLAGELHFKRGLKKKSGEAPLRENLAYLLLRKVVTENAENNKAPALTLIDPMAGSGTIVLEAAYFSTPLLSPSWSLWGMKSFEKVTKILLPKIQASLTPQYPSPFPYLLALEQDEKQFHALEKNFTENKLGSEQNIYWRQANSLKVSELPELTGQASSLLRVVLTNPPYNLRLKGKSPIKLILEMLDVAFDQWQCEQFYFILPNQFDGDFSAHVKKLNLTKSKNAREYKHQILLSFNHGGLRVSFHQVLLARRS